MGSSSVAGCSRASSAGTTTSSASKNNGTGAPAQQLHAWEERKAAQRAAREAQAQRKEQLFRAAMERKRAAEDEAREAAFQQLLGDVLGGLTAPPAAAATAAAAAPGDGGSSPSGSILSEVQAMLAHAEATHAARRAALHQQWSSRVFDVIQTRVQAAVAARSVVETEAALAAASDAYVRTVAAKRVFLDVVIDDEYDALAPLQRTICVPTGDLADPLLHDLFKAQAEPQLLGHGSGGGSGNSVRGPTWQSGMRSTSSSPSSSSSRASRRSGSAGSRSSAPAAGQQQQQQGATRHGLLAAVTRPVLPTTLWAAGQIHATPYGHCINDRTGEYVIRPAAPQSLAQKASRVWFDDFSV